MQEKKTCAQETCSVYLKVAEGGLFLTPTLVQTVLGSCLGGVFHAPSRGIGVIFHAFLPRRRDYGHDTQAGMYKYVDVAVEHTMAQFARHGVKPSQIRVSLVGGANGLVDEKNGVGIKNVEAALESLALYRLRPVFTDVGGSMGRKVFFHTGTGELTVVLLGDSGAKARAERRRSGR